MKKIAIITVVVILAIFAFFDVQIQKLETVVSAKLAQHETQFQVFSLGFFPQPYLAFENVKHNQISIEKLTGKFPLSALFSGNVKLQALEIQNAKWSKNAQNSADIQMRFSDFSLPMALSLAAIIQLRWNWQNPCTATIKCLIFVLLMACFSVATSENLRRSSIMPF